MTVTWHWNTEGALGLATHAKRQGEAETLCGAPAKDQAVMRPPFFEMRCEDCERLRGRDEEAFPNHQLDLLMAIRHETGRLRSLGNE